MREGRGARRQEAGRPRFREEGRRARHPGRARGGEAVILVENIRSYYDILLRNAAPFAPTPSAAASLTRLVLEIEERRKAYVKRIAAAKTISATEQEETGEATLRLPTIGQEVKD